MIFKQTGGEQWSFNQNWMQQQHSNGQPIHVCDWHGISCDQTKSIVGITLGANNLKGKLPTEIFMLPNLESLSFFGNKNLEISLEGIDNAENLRSLILDSTKLISLQGVGKARSLTELNVENNNLIGSLPDELGRLINLESLSVSKNKFTGTIPYWINNLPSLETFLAAENKFEGPVPHHANFKRLTYVDFSDNDLNGWVPMNFLQSVNNEEKIVVDLSRNKIEGSLPRELARLDRITIHLQDNHISEVDKELCIAVGWNDFDVERYGCDGILCPVGSSSVAGRQTSETTACEPCKEAKYMGSTACGSSGAAGVSLNVFCSSLSLITTTIVGMAMLL